jgi:hypothetical protein
MVCDVETCHALPYALGIGGAQETGERGEAASDGGVRVYRVNQKTALGTLLADVRAEMMRHGKPLVVVAAHVLRFDLGTLIFPHLKLWNSETAKHGVLEMPAPARCSVGGRAGQGKATFEYWFGKVVFAKLRVRNQTALFLDTYRYFGMSLDAAAKAVGLDLEKLEKPEGLGERRIRLPELRPYLVRDVEIVAALLEKILAWHRDYDLYPSVSVAQLSMRVLRRKYVTAKWQKVPRGVLRPSLLAYHAGRNGLYCGAGWHRVKLLDMNSAYPAAMRLLPSMSAGRWETVFEFAGPWAFYRVYAGLVNQGTYPILFQHDFKPLPDGKIIDPVWVTGLELGAAIKAGLIKGARCLGYVWRPKSTDTPLRDFVDDFWRKRRQAKTADNRTFFKLLLNSCYGKFVAKTELTGEEGETALKITKAVRDTRGEPPPVIPYGPPPGTVVVAGGQFYPPVAAWITAMVRVWLWQMERKTKAFHSATDGVMVDPSVQVHTSTKLGGWKTEGEGWALILRNKFYLVFNDEGELIKCAFHGYDGSIGELIGMLREGSKTYRVDRLRAWQESAILKRRPFMAERRVFAVSCKLRGYWPPPCPVIIPEQGWKKIVWSGLDVPDH